MRWLTALLLVVVLAGCDDGGTTPAPARREAGPPQPGGPVPAWHQPPDRAMDDLERPLATQLARRVAEQGLSLAYVDCPTWDGAVPGAMTCRGYVDGLLVDVAVRVWADPAGGSADGGARRAGVRFDARLGAGLVATARLEDTLHDRGWATADCGAVPAYPAARRTRIVCRVRRTAGARAAYVVATVVDTSGAVRISDAGE